MNRDGRFGLWACLALAGGCAGEIGGDPPSPARDAGTPDPPPPIERLVEGEPISALSIPLGAGEDVVVPVGDALLVRRAGALWWVASSTEAALGAIGPLLGGVALGGGAALVLAEDGARVFDGRALLPSPIAEALEGEAPRSAARSAEGAVWLATERSIFVYAEGVARRLRPGSLPTAGAVLAPLVDRRGAWVAAGGTAYLCELERAVVDGDVPGAIDALALDARGVVWARASGALARRVAGRWIDDRVGVDAVGPGWLGRSDGLAVVEGDRVRRIEGTEGARMLAAGEGWAIARRDDALLRVLPGRAVALYGLEDGAVLSSTRAFAAYGGGLTLSLDGVTLEGEPFRGGLRGVLDPARLGAGDHRLVASAGGAEEARSFSVVLAGPPTWAQDIAPLYRGRCATCHKSGGVAHDLDGAARWRAEIDEILGELRAGRMPLPPYPTLGATEIGRIDGWRAAGFPE